ncbi:MAG: isopentenyl-diphosphate Delta-isomerase [Clostridia bacterium]|jgi:isopentenyl-diphosphate delta-isomerase|nr:isopentenyl-diphosphate Delta-isomerase [Clostridia bacterium]MDN5322886.1 isopentenyl-diphosphate Delta-isomerase [Clostridia bacterium]
MDIREKRKWQHIKHALQVPIGPISTGFNDIYLVHQAVSCLDSAEINTSKIFLGKRLDFPLLINALTGGAAGLGEINQKLSLAAKECDIALAVGSQTAALNNPDTLKTFSIVRKINRDGLIFANVSALVDYKYALQAVEMIEADGLQLHLNLAQELAMPEGDRDFSGLLENIAFIKEKSPVPVIIKEVGFGISLETLEKLINIGIKFIDIGGAGGTNFAAIERARNKSFTNPNLVEWGIPTVISLIETLSVAKEISVCASGGIYSASSILKSLALGADLVGIALPVLEKAYHNDVNDIIKYINNLKTQVKELMLLTGAREICDLKTIPIIVTGFVKEWLEARGIDISHYAKRSLQQPI